MLKEGQKDNIGFRRNIRQKIRRKFRRVRRKSFFRARQLGSFFSVKDLSPLPLRNSLRGYGFESFRCDTRAGVSVALLAFPQSIAYAAIAGLPLSFGILSTIAASLIAAFFLGSLHTAVGPTNATAFMLFSFFITNDLYGEERYHALVMIVLLAGFLLIMWSYFHLAELIQYISRSVITGYLNGAAFLIMINQLRHVFGLPDVKGKTFFDSLQALLARIGDASLPTVLLSVLSAFIFILMKKYLPRLPIFALAILLATLLATLASKYFGLEFERFEPVDLSSLNIGFKGAPDFSFFTGIGDYFGIAFAIAFLCALENTVMAKSLASRAGVKPRLNQDLLGLGLANLACAYARAMPASGSLTRSALNFSSGARTQISALVSGSFGLLIALLLTPFLSYLPKAVLASLIICVSITLIKPKEIRACIYATNSDALTFLATFFSALLIPLHIAIFIGVGVSVALYLRKVSKPFLVEYEFNEEGNLTLAKKRRDPFISIVHVEGELFFGASEVFRGQIEEVAQDEDLKIIILRMRNAYHLDATSVIAFSEMITFLHDHGRHVIISGANKQILRVLKYSGVLEQIGRKNIFANYPTNPTLATRKALIRAQELLGQKSAEIKIYHNPNKVKKSEENNTSKSKPKAAAKKKAPSSKKAVAKKKSSPRRKKAPKNKKTEKN